MDFGLALFGTGDAHSLHHIFTIVWRVLLVLIGVNALIIVHEFGHFIVARWCGVRCDKFYIWFDAYNFRFFRFKWGDTEYGLGWVPLGGYVKMLGQEDNPSQIKNEIERARLEAESDDPAVSAEARQRLAEQQRHQEEVYAPDSFLSKNVFQRMAIISAGVIMNIIFAVFCAAWAYMLGFPEPTSRLGEVFPDSPAWQTGLVPGDRITAIDGKPCRLFSDIRLAMLDRKQVDLTIERRTDSSAETIHKLITPTMEKGQLAPTIGVYPSPAIQIASAGPVCLTLDPAAMSESAETLKKIPRAGRLVAMNGEPVETPADYQHLARKFLDTDITYEFVPAGKNGEPEPDGEHVAATLPPNPFAETGIRLAMGEITSVAEDSPAAGAGFRAAVRDESGTIIENGDVIAAVNNEPVLDPILFPYQIHRLAVKGGGKADIVLTVNREGNEVDIPLSITASESYTGTVSFRGRMASSEIGISYMVRPFIAGTDASVSFDTEPSPIGLHISSIEVGLTEPQAPEKDDPASPYFEKIRQYYRSILEIGKPNGSGGFIIEAPAEPEQARDKILSFFTDYINYLPSGTPLVIRAGIGSEPQAVLKTAVTRPGNAYQIDRSLAFDYTETQIASSGNLLQALAAGWAKTVDSMGAIYRQLVNIGRNVSAKAFGGPVMIVDIAYKAAGSKDGTFLLFLCLISANLAVVNILPIPVLDGGHLLFLIYELIFRKRPNETVQVILSYIGLFLILGLMIWVIFLDIARVAGLM
ncbi:MAG: site-2 protease family protein [Thermoguttaceae bacterium]|nr:site-2 protease family protein [Thermoguttaceae bacterium]